MAPAPVRRLNATVSVATVVALVVAMLWCLSLVAANGIAAKGIAGFVGALVSCAVAFSFVGSVRSRRRSAAR